MKPGARDKVERKFHEVKVKVEAGQLTNNRRLQAEGIVETAAGKVQGIATTATSQGVVTVQYSFNKRFHNPYRT